MTPTLGRRALAGAMLATLVLLAGCQKPMPRTIEVQPSYVFALGAGYDDVLAMLGPPNRGPRWDRFSNLSEVVYIYATPAIQAETHFPDGTTRAEMVDRIHLFFDRKGVLKQMAHRTNRHYTAIAELPVHRITVLPRAREMPGPVIDDR